MITKHFERYLSILDCFASEDRIRILGLLVREDLSIEELSGKLGLKTAKISHHLSLLHELDFIRMNSVRNIQVYGFNRAFVEQLINELHPEKTRIDEWNTSKIPDPWELKVLHTFIENDRIKSIPISRKKRQVILNWLINKFEKEVSYNEKEVNEIILRYHPDKATLRREFIINKLMAREDGGGTYWRL